MSVVIFIEANEGKIKKSSFEAIAYGVALAQQKKVTANGIAIGNFEIGALENAGQFGITDIIHFSNNTEHFDAQLYTNILSGECSDAKYVVLSHNYSGKALAPRVSVKLKAGLVSAVVSLPNDNDEFERNLFSGKAKGFVKSLTATTIITVNPNSFTYVSSEGTATIVQKDTQGTRTVEVVNIEKTTDKIPLSEADIVVSAGRGLKGPENWGMIEELAELLGAATACSRPVADSDWRPHHEHVGQTGLAIRPNLYFAIGISGAIQHLAGVNGSKVIVVINTDATAPFFESADYGIVGDAFEVVPKLIDSIKRYKAN